MFDLALVFLGGREEVMRFVFGRRTWLGRAFEDGFQRLVVSMRGLDRSHDETVRQKRLKL